MDHLKIKLYAVGNTLSALSKAKLIAVAINEPVIVDLHTKKLIYVRPDSNIQDVAELADTMLKLYEFEIKQDVK